MANLPHPCVEKKTHEDLQSFKKKSGKNAQKLTQLVFFGSIQPVEEQCIETLIHER